MDLKQSLYNGHGLDTSMPGELEKDSVIIKDQTEASQIYNKGFYGYPLSGGSLELDLLEATYLVESDRLEVLNNGQKMTIAQLVGSASLAHRDFEIKYIVYRDLRQRGYVVKAAGGEFDFRVFPRGGTPASSQTKHWVVAISERSAFSIAFFSGEVERSDKTRKELLLAVVDEEGDITYYKANFSDPKGVPPTTWTGEPVKASLLEDRVLVFDDSDADRLYSFGFFGKKLGKSLQLSLIETAYLMDEGILKVSTIATARAVGLDHFKKRALKFQPDFDLRLRAYRDLRSRGMVVKTGFKYGSHFRVYEGDPKKGMPDI